MHRQESVECVRLAELADVKLDKYSDETDDSSLSPEPDLDKLDSEEHVLGLLSDLNTPRDPLRKRRCFSARTKLEAIELAKTTNVHLAAERYGVDRKCIRDWCLKEKLLKRCSGDKMRIKGAGRPRTRHLKPMVGHEQGQEERTMLSIYSAISAIKTEECHDEPESESPKCRRSDAPPLLERMDDSDEECDPPSLSPSARYSLRPKQKPSAVPTPQQSPAKRIKSEGRFHEHIPCTSSTQPNNEMVIDKLQAELAERNEEIRLLKKKLFANEELLNFYMNRSQRPDDRHTSRPLRIGNQRILWKSVGVDAGCPTKATAMVMEGNQEKLHQLLKNNNNE